MKRSKCNLKVANIVTNSFTFDNRVLNTSISLSCFGYELETIAVHNKGLQEEEYIGGIKVNRIRLICKDWPSFKPIQLMKYLEFVLKVLVRCRNFNIIHCNDLSALPVGVLIKLFGNNVHIVYDAHEYETEIDGRKGIKKTARKFIERYLISYADQVITVSETIANEYVRLYRIKKPFLVLNCPKYAEQKKLNLFRDHFRIRSDQKIFLYQGVLTLGRGIELLLEVFKKLEDDRYVMVFMGYGPFEDRLNEEMKLSKNIYLHPAVSHHLLLNYTSSADFGISFIEDVSLSDRFCLPNKLFEYMMAGLPVLVSNLPEMKRFVEATGVGIVAEDNTASGFERAVYRAINMNYQQTVKRVHVARKKYCWENQEIVLREIYESFSR